MSIDLCRDDQARRIVATGHGPFNANDIISTLSHLRDQGAWNYTVLLDLRRMTGAPSVSELRPILEIASARGDDEGARGVLAIVVHDLQLYGMACAYAALAQPRGRVAVFRDHTEAEAWLALRTQTRA